ncbi:MAG: hypothetical protein IT376_10075 [Polyangiaceae bacterium]|nr:hypothetical protein [Polyangiaceae bacterium]
MAEVPYLPTGGLVERATSRARGSAERRYRQQRWRGLREDYGFAIASGTASARALHDRVLDRVRDLLAAHV